MKEAFWELNVGHVLTLAVLLVSFWTAHRANVKRYQEDAKDRQEMKTKLDVIYDWFKNSILTSTRHVNGVDYTELRSEGHKPGGDQCTKG